jgi:uncharacterized ferritin-like protein (DUF455 family)
MTEITDNLFESALICIQIDDPYKKADCASSLHQRWCAGELDTAVSSEPVRIEKPGRPVRPRLVSPRQVPKRGFNSRQGLNKLAHAIAHIEFNAINLALDAAYRFRGMPEDYYSDWLRVAAEESNHFIMLSDYLQANGSNYGDYDAHNGLWEMALKTQDDVMIRMALVPRVLEARGLDVTPGMIDRLSEAGEEKLVDILKIIHKEEIGHVLVGTRWFNHVCHQRGLNPQDVFIQLLVTHVNGVIHGPFDEESRLQAGFTENEIQRLQAISEKNEVTA